MNGGGGNSFTFKEATELVVLSPVALSYQESSSGVLSWTAERHKISIEIGLYSVTITLVACLVNIRSVWSYIPQIQDTGIT